MLNFIGNGSAFNTKLGNNGAYVKHNGVLFLIDCGSSTFQKLLENKILDDVKYIYVLITHYHADHIGSLGDLILYSYYSMGTMGEVKINLIEPSENSKNKFMDNTNRMVSIEDIMNLMGISFNNYNLSELDHEEYTSIAFDLNFEGEFEIMIKPVQVKHVEELDCFGYEIIYNDIHIYYSGDCYEIPEEKLKLINEGYYDYVFQDVCKADYEGNVHLSLNKLDKLIVNDRTIRNKIFCMHLDQNFSKDEAIKLGFNITKTI